MQQSHWQRLRKRGNETLALFLLPTLALAGFFPQARKALAATQVRAGAITRAAAPARLVADRGRTTRLEHWQPTQSIIEPTRNISQMYNAEINSFTATIPSLPVGSPQYVGAQMQVSATYGFGLEFEANYKVISNNTSVFQAANLVSAFLHGEERAFFNLAASPTTPSFAQGLLGQKAAVVSQEIDAFESWYKLATANKLDPDTILSQLTTFTKSFLTASQTFTAFQVQELNSGTISATTFTYTAPQF